VFRAYLDGGRNLSEKFTTELHRGVTEAHREENELRTVWFGDYPHLTAKSAETAKRMQLTLSLWS
jgi:hypothetical protein